MTRKYVYSFTDEWFNSDEYDTPKEAVEAARELEKESLSDEPHTEVYIGTVGEQWKPEIDGESIVEMIRENAMDDCGGNIVDDSCYLEKVSEEQMNELTKELTAAFNRWAEKNGHTVNFYPVENVKEYKLWEK